MYTNEQARERISEIEEVLDKMKLRLTWADNHKVKCIDNESAAYDSYLSDIDFVRTLVDMFEDDLKKKC